MSDSSVPKKLQSIANEAHKGQVPKHDLKELLAAFGQARRSAPVNRRIEDALASVNLRTEPNFRAASLEDTLKFYSLRPEVEVQEDDNDDEVTADRESYLGEGENRDQFLYRVRRFVTNATTEAMKQKMEAGVESVARDKEIQYATTVMMAKDYSQLPVMQNERDVEGLISWKSIGKTYAQDEKPEFVRDCMSSPPDIIHENHSIFDLIDAVRSDEVALIRDQQRKIVTLFTAADLADLYKNLSQPFIYLGEIEHRLRALLVEGQFSQEQLESVIDVKDDRTIERPDDLTFGEYKRIMENPECWDAIGLGINRQVFIDQLEEIRIIRNAVMHFDPDGLTSQQIQELETFISFLRALELD